MTQEQFDLNRCTVSGILQKIWDRHGDIFLRLAFLPEADKPLRYLTLRLPEGQVDGQLISLQPGERIRVSGYLVDAPYTESLAEFLWDARKKDLLDDLENTDQLRQIQIKRIGTRLDVLELERLQADAAPQGANVMVQGVVAKVWDSSRHRMVRLAIYDQYTEITKKGQNGKRPKRKPHYITARFVDGKVGDQEITLRKRNRIRLSGALQIRFYKETLREVLMRSGNANLVGDFHNIDLDEVFAIRNSVSVTAHSAIVLASMGRAELQAN